MHNINSMIFIYNYYFCDKNLLYNPCEVWTQIETYILIRQNSGFFTNIKDNKDLHKQNYWSYIKFISIN